MRKLFTFVVIIFFMASCGSSKSIVQNTVRIDQNEEKNDIKKRISLENEEVFDHSPWNSILNTYVDKDGNVNYKGLKKVHPQLKSYIATLSNNTPQESWRKEEKLAYWINAYNALTVDLILRNYPLSSIKDIKKPWDQSLWELDGKSYNLNEIEHKILRKMNEPRIHFAIVCASFSCPILSNEAYSASKLEDQLTKATKSFLTDTNRNVITPDHLELSKIFKWFAKDFKENGTLIDFLNRYSDVTISSSAKRSFKDYNWNLNE